ncbi:MAG: ACP S-malonyltransferase [Epsilonproteobacteria bacterium]|nr:ACP S-malonyltransferase [Campylobacterota bacterium]
MNVAYIFAGQGSQSIGMGKEFYESSELAKEMFKKASERIGVDFEDLIFNENEKLNETAYTQPAILLVQMVAYRHFRQECVDAAPKYFLGHSLGEFSALCATGAIAFEDAIELVHKRGLYMQEACSEIEAGMMAIVGLDDTAVEEICEAAQKEGKKVWPANYNQDGQLVVAGLKPDLASLEQTFKDAGAKRALLLNMSVASHCALLESAVEKLAPLMESYITDNFEAPIISNVTTKPYSTKAEAIELLKQQLTSPVRYKQSILAIADEVESAVEFGNGVVLKGLNRRIAKSLKTLNVAKPEDVLKVKEELC